MANRRNIVNMSLESSLTNFSGGKDEDIKFFIDKINRISILEDWPAARKTLVLQMHLKGDALKFLINDQRAKNEQDFDNLCRLLIEKFSIKMSFNEAQSKFQNVSQQQGQKVKDLADIIDNLGNIYMNPNNSELPEVLNLTEKVKLNKFLEALRQDIQFEVKKSAPRTFAEAIEKAKNFELALDSMGTSQNNDLNVNALFQQQLETNKSILVLQNQILDLTKANVNTISAKSMPKSNENEKSYNNQNSSDRVTCHICGKRHLTTDCWHFPRQFNNQSRRNFNYRGNSNRRNFRGRNNNRNSRFKPYKKNNLN